MIILPFVMEFCGFCVYAQIMVTMKIEAVYYYEARAQAKLRNYDSSNALLRRALAKAKSPTMEWYYDGIGDNFESMKQYKKAVAHYDTAYYLYKDPLASFALRVQ